jgi:hypothetical protein
MAEKPQFDHKNWQIPELSGPWRLGYRGALAYDGRSHEVAGSGWIAPVALCVTASRQMGIEP